MKRPNPQTLVDKFNAQYPIGTPVTRYKLINPLREPQDTQTRSAAWVMGGHSAMVMVNGVAGGVLVESVLPRDLCGNVTESDSGSEFSQMSDATGAKKEDL